MAAWGRACLEFRLPLRPLPAAGRSACSSPPPMRKPKLNRLSACNAQASVREQRITDEIIVDAYGSEEQAMGYEF